MSIFDPGGSFEERSSRRGPYRDEPQDENDPHRPVLDAHEAASEVRLEALTRAQQIIDEATRRAEETIGDAGARALRITGLADMEADLTRRRAGNEANQIIDRAHTEARRIREEAELGADRLITSARLEADRIQRSLQETEQRGEEARARIARMEAEFEEAVRNMLGWIGADKETGKGAFGKLFHKKKRN